MRASLVAAVCLIALTGCVKNDPMPERLAEKREDAAPAKQYDLRGEVISVDADDRIAKIKHDEIVGWMGAMTMDFPVKDDADLAKLKPGKQIRAKVNVQDLSYWLSGIE